MNKTIQYKYLVAHGKRVCTTKLLLLPPFCSHYTEQSALASIPSQEPDDFTYEGVLSSLCLNTMPLLVLSICLTCRFRVTVSALLSLVCPVHQLLYHLLHWNVMCFEQLNFIWFFDLRVRFILPFWLRTSLATSRWHPLHSAVTIAVSCGLSETSSWRQPSWLQAPFCLQCCLPPSRGTLPRCFSWTPAAAARLPERRPCSIREPAPDLDRNDPPDRLTKYSELRRIGSSRPISVPAVCPTWTASCVSTSAASAAVRLTQSGRDARTCCACLSTQPSESDKERHACTQLVLPLML